MSAIDLILQFSNKKRACEISQIKDDHILLEN